VFTAFETLIECKYYEDNAADFSKLVTYFCRTFLGKLITRRKRKNAKYPVKVWNMYNSVLNDLLRSNNNVEEWNNAFSSMLNACHVNIYRFIEGLKNDQVLTTKKVVDAVHTTRNQKKPYAAVS